MEGVCECVCMRVHAWDVYRDGMNERCARLECATYTHH